MRFVKAHGTGNDFVLLPDLEDRIELTPDLVRALCAPHLGVGADGVIRIGTSPDGDVFMDHWNADGSTAEMCGNGVRCVAKYVLDREIVEGDSLRVDTRAGVKRVEARRGADGKVVAVRVDMGAPVPGGVNQPLDVQRDGAEEIVHITTLSMGNPHAVLVVDDVAAAPVRTLGPEIEGHRAFPDRTNVEFIHVRGRDRIEGRIWERGVGETMASGTGSSAMAVAAHLLGLADRSVTVALPGGELRIEWTDETLYVEGPAVEVAEGELSIDWLASL
jgi:diaminopimelate epimerase